MSCETQRKAFWDSMNALSDAHNKAYSEQRKMEILMRPFEKVCGYYQGNGEWVIDPIEPGHPDFPEGGPTCPEAFSDWFDQFVNWISARRLIEEQENRRRDRWRELSRCQHQNKD